MSTEPADAAAADLVVRAIEELRAVRSTDPAAAPAVRAARLTALTLERWWLDAIRPGSDVDPSAR